MDPVYAGMIVGEHSRSGDLACNPTKTKKLGNYRAETKEIDVGLKVPREMTLDQALEWIAADELVEVTPKSIRVRKAILDFRGAQEGQPKLRLRADVSAPAALCQAVTSRAHRSPSALPHGSTTSFIRLAV